MVAGDPGEMCCSVGCENISVEPRTRALRNKMGKRARKKFGKPLWFTTRCRAIETRAQRGPEHLPSDIPYQGVY